MSNKMKFQTPDLTAANTAKLNELFPNLISEGKVNLDALRSFVGEEVWEREAYEFTWVGKREAIAEAGRPIRRTLRPVPSESKDWDTTENLYIEGDNLDVLKLLQESYLGKVKMIYTDPPYNTGHDFIYNDSFRSNDEEYDEEISLFDENGNKNFRENSDSNPRFHSDWCSMIYPRLVLARNLLSNDGAIFISIDDNEVAQLRKICDEVFGVSNFIGQITVVANPRGRDYGGIARMHDYILAYRKSDALEMNLVADENSEFPFQDTLGGFELRELRNRNIKFNKENRRNLWYPFYINTAKADENDLYEIDLEPREGWLELYPLESQGINTVWRWGKPKAAENLNINIKAKPMRNGSYMIVEKYREARRMARSVWWDKDSNTEKGTLLVKDMFQGKVFDYPKPMEMISRLVQMGSDEDGLVLDFFSGSATTAHAVMRLNAEDGGKRKFIMVQLPELCAEGTEAAKAGFTNICEIGKERIRRAGDKIKAGNPLGTAELDAGFRVLKLDDTNMNDVYYNAHEWANGVKDNGEQLDLEGLIDNVKSDRTAGDLLYGCLLEWGLPLNRPHVVEKIAGFDAQNYNDGDLYACFEKGVTEELVREIANRCKERQPLTSRVVFRDDSFTSSPQKINLFEIFKLLAPNASVRVI
ncbi:site-specific DNA-methyltransferase [Synergistales bacterium]|nr:site-specific DNA-methyltransferase [Synergistales bacterium]